MPYRRWLIIGLVGWFIGAASIGSAQTDEEAAWDDGELESPVAAPAALQADRRVSMDLQDANLKDVFKIFSQQSGLNFIASEEIGDRHITLYLDRVGLQDALDQIVRANHLTYDKLPGSDIFIVNGPAGPTTITRIYKLKYARLSTSILGRAISAFGEITPFEGLKGFGSTTASGTGAGGTSGGSGTGGGGEQEEIEIGIDKVVEKLLTKAGSLAVDERTNSLIITDVESNFSRLEQAIAQLDVKTAQILIEAELVEVNAQKAKGLGIEWGQASDGTLTTLTPAKAAVSFPYSGLGNKSLGNLNSLEIASGTKGITLGTLDSSQLTVILKAIETDTTSKILARPKILTLDNESATIRLSAQTAIGTLTTVASETGATISQSAERTETGVRLVVTPQVNEDGYITLLLEPAVSRPIASSFSAFTSKFVDPKTRSARTLVRVKDGETIVLGGLIDRQDKTAVRKVPFLGDLPLVGALFRREEVSDDDTELMVFITPRIVKDEPRLAQAPPREPVAAEPIAQREQERPAAERDEAIDSLLNRMERTER
ncbi:MAG: hypothetical protein HY597_01460 [Candidatus Omnitrophica bacterium]|nr:hypothetical protein [Candidatus Omnitrophota bacterium]